MRIATWNVNSLRSRIDRVEALPAAPRHRRARRAGDQGARGPAAADGAHRARVRRRVGRLRPVERRRDHLPRRDRGRRGRVPGHADVGRSAAAEARAIGATCGGVRVWSLYVPNGRKVDDPHYVYKLDWLARLRAAARSLTRRRRAHGRLEHRAAGRGRLRHGGFAKEHPRHPAGAGRVRRRSSRTGTSTSYVPSRRVPTSSPTGTTTGSATSATAACGSTSCSATRRWPPA